MISGTYALTCKVDCPLALFVDVIAFNGCLYAIGNAIVA